MNNKYRNEVLDYASRLDVLTKGYGKFYERAIAVIEDQNETTIKTLLLSISKEINDENCTDEIKQISKKLKDSFYKYYGYIKVYEIYHAEQKEDLRTLSELQSELDELIGLEKVKFHINNLIAYQRVQKIRQTKGLKKVNNTMHLAFLGNPGTGKTTVARIVGRIYKQIELLSKGHFIEVSRSDLIAGYQGQTALKVKKVIEKSKGGVLFIDEAYSITENDHSDSYGRECLSELTKALEDYRDDLVVIVAGYTEPMNKFFESNPGLKSRFNTFIDFDDYTVEELEEILINMCKKDDYILQNKARDKIRQILIAQIDKKDENFANGRLVRNIYNDMVMKHAKRVINIKELSPEILSELTSDDCP